MILTLFLTCFSQPASLHACRVCMYSHEAIVWVTHSGLCNNVARQMYYPELRISLWQTKFAGHGSLHQGHEVDTRPASISPRSNSWLRWYLPDYLKHKCSASFDYGIPHYRRSVVAIWKISEKNVKRNIVKILTISQLVLNINT